MQELRSDSGVIISALSVVLGMVLGNVAEDDEAAVDIAVETIYRAIAASGEDDWRGRSAMSNLTLEGRASRAQRRSRPAATRRS